MQQTILIAQPCRSSRKGITILGIIHLIQLQKPVYQA